MAYNGYVKRKKTKLKLFCIALCILIFYLYYAASKLILDAGGVYFNASVSNCAYATINNCTKKFDFSSICSLKYGSDGNVVLVSTDSQKLNEISVFLADNCYECLNNLILGGYFVPAGVFSGIKLLSGFGPDVNIKLVTVLSVQCAFVREFMSAGINQTRMTLSLVINCDITIYSIFEKKNYNGLIEALVYDNVIVGKVPEVYLSREVVTAKTTKD